MKFKIALNKIFKFFVGYFLYLLFVSLIVAMITTTLQVREDKLRYKVIYDNLQTLGKEFTLEELLYENEVSTKEIMTRNYEYLADYDALVIAQDYESNIDLQVIKNPYNNEVYIYEKQLNETVFALFDKDSELHHTIYLEKSALSFDDSFLENDNIILLDDKIKQINIFGHIRLTLGEE